MKRTEMIALKLLLYYWADNVLFVFVPAIWQYDCGYYISLATGLKAVLCSSLERCPIFYLENEKKMLFYWFNLWAVTFRSIMQKVSALQSGISGSNPSSTSCKLSGLGQVSEHVSLPIKDVHFAGCGKDWKREWQGNLVGCQSWGKLHIYI